MSASDNSPPVGAPRDGGGGAGPAQPSSRRERFAWCLFDFANSAFPTLALTAFGGPYFAGVLVGDAGVDVAGVHLGPTAAWGLVIPISMALVTVTAPIMGAIADRSGRKRAILAVYVAICVAATAGLGLLPPASGLLACALYIVANFAFEGAYVFYNAFLPELATPDRVGRLSAYGWALGYGGGLLALILCMPMMPESYSPEHAGDASRIYLIVAGWYLVFSLPTLLWLRDRPVVRPTVAAAATTGRASARSEVGAALRALGRTIRSLPTHPAILFFLIAYFLYNDAITTVIEFTGIYTKEVLAFTPSDNAWLFLVLNVVAAPGALVFGVLVDRIGGRRTIGITLWVWVLVVVLAVFATTKASFWPVAGLAAVVIGATQASSRALMARLAPAGRVGEFMGFLALSGKASAVFGPIIYGVVAEGVAARTSVAEGHRAAIAVIGVFFVVAFFVLRRVREPAIGVAGESRRLAADEGPSAEDSD